MIVAVIDIGMDLEPPAYKDKILKSDFRGEDAVYPKDKIILAHGTAVLIGLPSPKVVKI